MSFKGLQTLPCIQESVPRGVIYVSSCLSIKGAEDTLNKPNSFEITTSDPDRMFFIADTYKEKEDWINAIGRAIVRSSLRWNFSSKPRIATSLCSVMDSEQQDYTTKQ